MQTAVDAYGAGGIDALFNNAADLRPETVEKDTDAVAIDVEHWNYILDDAVGVNAQIIHVNGGKLVNC